MGCPRSAGCWSSWMGAPGGLPPEIPKTKCQLIDASKDPLLSPIVACGPTSYSVLTNHLPGREWALPVFAGASLAATGGYPPLPPAPLASVLVWGSVAGAAPLLSGHGKVPAGGAGLPTVRGGHAGAAWTTAGRPRFNQGRPRKSAVERSGYGGEPPACLAPYATMARSSRWLIPSFANIR